MVQNSLMVTEMRTTRVRRTWFDKLLLWQRAYETRILDGHHDVVGRGPTPEQPKRMLSDDGSRLRPHKPGLLTPISPGCDAPGPKGRRPKPTPLPHHWAGILTAGISWVGSDPGRCAIAGLGGLWAAMAHSVRCRGRIYRSHHLRRQRRYRAVGRVGFPAGARGYCDKYGKPKNVHRPSHVIALANWFVSADP